MSTKLNLVTEFDHDYEAVLIIGNGFDLNFGLKTGYNDFVASNYFKSLAEKGNSLVNYLEQQNSLLNWIDIENELKKYSSKIAKDDKGFFYEFVELSMSLSKYLKTIKLDSFDRNNHGFKLINKLKDYTLLIIDFNYTDTVIRLVEEIIDEDSNQLIDLVKIHGSIAEDNIIFGVEDQASIKSEHVFLKKSVNKNFKAIDFNLPIEQCSNFFVFGHSLGETDHMYFSDFFYNATSNKYYEKKNIILYYYGEESYYSLFSQIDVLTRKKISKLKQRNNFHMINTKTTLK
ncbi:AbiH family protein [Saccharicrinis sp. FJH62]|uniref:AbiH family protein n=1 Tax=Saccharicrinis sp. FJH62 TaxID=3344657 RepID=UPI0035D46574